MLRFLCCCRNKKNKTAGREILETNQNDKLPVLKSQTYDLTGKKEISNENYGLMPHVRRVRQSYTTIFHKTYHPLSNYVYPRKKAINNLKP